MHRKRYIYIYQDKYLYILMHIYGQRRAGSKVLDLLKEKQLLAMAVPSTRGTDASLVAHTEK